MGLYGVLSLTLVFFLLTSYERGEGRSKGGGVKALISAVVNW